jgi:hypothetical protein
MCYNFGMCLSFFKGYMPPRKTYGKKYEVGKLWSIWNTPTRIEIFFEENPTITFSTCKVPIKLYMYI